MCNLYTPATAAALIKQFGVTPPSGYRGYDVFRASQGPFIRRNLHESNYSRELVFGRWGLIPWFSKTADVKYATNNARSEELEEKASYKQPWAKSQRCLIPADVFWEPCWETGKNQWWSFRRADGNAFALAGLWNTWENKATGELQESYTMLTMNADKHPVFKRMHKPDPKLPPDAQDKRMVVVLESEAWDQWLVGSPAEARRLILPAALASIIAMPDETKGKR